MALPFWVTEMGSYKGPQGDDGEKGRPGTFDKATARTVAADQPARAIILGEFGEILELEIPQGLPGVNAVPAASAVAAYINAPGTEARGAAKSAAVEALPGQLTVAGTLARVALDALYPVYLLWNGTAYPPRVPNALNIFFGPVFPGLLMEADDRWEQGNATSLDTVVAQALDTSSPLFSAMQLAAVANPLYFDANAMGPAVGSTLERVVLGTSPNQVLAWKLPKGASSNMYLSHMVPIGWTKIRVRVFWTHTVAGGTGNARLVCNVTSFSTGTAPAGGTGVQTSQSVGEVNTMRETVFSGDNPVPANGMFSILFGRLGAAGADTFTGDIHVVGGRIERVA